MLIVQLETFLRVAWKGSFTKAAIDQNLTQSSVSARIAGLEAELGRALFVRRGSRVELTAAGEALIPIAEQMTQLGLQARERVRLAGGIDQRTQTLRLGSNASAAYSFLPGVIRKFHLQERGVRVILEVDRTGGLMPHLMEGVIAMAFVNRTLSHHLTEVMWSHQGPSTLVADKGHPLAGKTASLARVAREAFVTFTLGPGVQVMYAFERAAGRSLVIAAESSSIRAVHSLVLEGMGMAFLPVEAVAQDIAAGNLCEITIEDFIPGPWEVVLVRWRGRDLDAAALRFLDVLKTELPTLPIRSKAEIEADSARL
jgi:DNA-binding transcriptional LysR family regulator